MAQILVPFDFSKNAQTALDQALLLVAATKKSLEVLHITNKAICRAYPASWKCNEKSTDTLREKLEAIVEKRIRAHKLTMQKKVAVFVKEAALVPGGIIGRMLQSGARLLVMGTHGSSGLYDKVFGSNTAVMVNHALFPVLTVPPYWEPVTIEHCVAALKLSKLNASAKTILEWGRFFKCNVEAVQFSIIPEGEGALARKTNIGGVLCRMIKNDIETTLAEDLLRYTAPMQKTILLVFTREKTFLEKLFIPNLTYKLSGAIAIPLLSVPLEDFARK